MVLLVGEAPSLDGTGSGGPLSGASGRRLAQYAGVRFELLLARPRVNVYEEAPGVWSASVARHRAAAVLDSSDASTLVLLGRRVAAAFGLDAPWLSLLPLGPDRRAFLVPHPSGRCRVWNDPDFRARARGVLRYVLVG